MQYVHFELHINVFSSVTWFLIDVLEAARVFLPDIFSFVSKYHDYVIFRKRVFCLLQEIIH